MKVLPFLCRESQVGVEVVVGGGGCAKEGVQEEVKEEGEGGMESAGGTTTRVRGLTEYFKFSIKFKAV